ncbi:MAG: DMT family transporter [Clostridiales bacterium]
MAEQQETQQETQQVQKKNRLKSQAPRLALFMATLIWGSSFVMMKNAVGAFPPNYLLMIRFGVSCLFLSLIFWRRLKAIDRSYLMQTAIIGLCLSLAYTLQTLGIQHTTPGKNAFLTAIYVIIVPFLHWFLEKQKPGGKNLLAAVVCLAGIGLISLTSQLTIGLGDGYTLLGGFFFAAHMVCVGFFSQDKDPILITILQFGYCALFFGIAALSLETFPRTIDAAGAFNLFYLTFFCTSLALLLQNYGQKYTSPSTASLLLSLESIFGVLFSVFFYDEVLTLRLVIGFALVFGAILIAEGNFSLKSRSELSLAGNEAAEQQN